MAGRHAKLPLTERRTAWTILAVGTIVSIASLFGSVWLIRAGVLVAIGMAFLAVHITWKQLERERNEHLEQIREQVAIRTALSEKHHSDSVAMIDRFTARSDALKSIIFKLRRQLAAANGELSTMRGNSVWLRAEVSERQATIEALNSRIAELETELGEKVVTMPRRGTTNVQPSVEDIWQDDEHPTLVDLTKLQLDDITERRREA